jgi:hypothetical protein
VSGPQNCVSTLNILQSPPPSSTPHTHPPLLIISPQPARSWAWRTWEFAVALILIRLHPGSLALISGYGLVDNLVRVAGGAPVGRYVDSSERLQGATAMYLLQNGCILASAAAAGLLLWLAGGAAAPLEAVGPAVRGALGLF